MAVFGSAVKVNGKPLHDLIGTPACTEEEWAKAKESLALQVKALVARDLFDMSEYFEIMNTNNATVQKAIELLSKK